MSIVGTRLSTFKCEWWADRLVDQRREVCETGLKRTIEEHFAKVLHLFLYDFPSFLLTDRQREEFN